MTVVTVVSKVSVSNDSSDSSASSDRSDSIVCSYINDNSDSTDSSEKLKIICFHNVESLLAKYWNKSFSFNSFYKFPMRTYFLGL